MTPHRCEDCLTCGTCHIGPHPPLVRWWMVAAIVLVAGVVGWFTAGFGFVR